MKPGGRFAELRTTFNAALVYHTSKASLTALAARSAWLTVEWLPRYAPELNAIEGTWRDLKRHHLAHRRAPRCKAS